jgi:hypothetical protein
LQGFTLYTLYIGKLKQGNVHVAQKKIIAQQERLEAVLFLIKKRKRMKNNEKIDNI